MTMAPAPGTFLWLLVHDLRLSWRGFTGLFRGAGTSTAILVLVACFAGLHLVAWPTIGWLKSADATDTGLKQSLPIAAGIAAAFMWMVAQSVFGSTRTLYDRADLDLLLGSPVPAARVIAAKAVAIMAGTLGSIALFLVPLANVGAVIDTPNWLGIYPALVGLGLIATSIGLGVTLGLFLLLGPRRARVYSHMTGAALGASFVLGAQVYAVMPDETAATVGAWLKSVGLSQVFGLGVWTDLPSAAVGGDLRAAITLVAIGIALFTATIAFLGPRFARAAMVARGAPANGATSRRPTADRRFRAGVGTALRVKEWRLLVRDPGLFAQLGLQIIYTIPVAVVLVRSSIVPMAFALVPTLVVIAAQVAGSISWITISGEDAPELITTAPVTAGHVERAKISAVAMPMLFLLAVPLVGLTIVEPFYGLIATVFAAAAGASTSLINFWHPMPGNRRGMLRRHTQSKLIGLVEHGLAMLWALTAVFAVAAPAMAIGPAAINAVVLWGMSRSRPRVQLPMRSPEPATA